MRRIPVLVAIVAPALSLLGTGCPPAPEVDTGLVPAEDCVLDAQHFELIDLQPAKIPTVFEVSWSTAEPSRGQVLFTAGDELWTTDLESETATEHHALLVGSPAQATVELRLVSRVGDELLCSDTFTETTPAPPPELPVLTVDADYASSEPHGWVSVPLGAGSTTIPTMVDSQGRYCWWWEDDGYFFYGDMAADGRSMLLLASGFGIDGVGTVLELGLDGEVLRDVDVPGAHNDLVETPDGSLYLLGRERYDAEVDGEQVSLTSDTVIELLPDGSQIELWSAREALWDSLYNVIEQKVRQGGPSPVDWSHGTTIAFDALGDRLLVALTGANVLVGIDRSSGGVDWVLGGDGSTLTNTGSAGQLVTVPHSIQAVAGGVLLYNQQQHRDGEVCGEATEVALDVASSSAELAWWGREPDCTSPDVMGSAHRLPDDNTLMAGGPLGRLSWLDPQGELVWRLSGDLGTIFGGASHVAAFH